MPQPGRRQRLPQVLTAMAVPAVALHLYGLYRPTGPPTPSWFPHADKLEHALGFAAPLALVLLARNTWAQSHASSAGVTRGFLSVVVGVFALHAVVSELVQAAAYVHRTGDPADVLADWLGVALGLATWRLAGNRRTGRDTPRGPLVPARREP